MKRNRVIAALVVFACSSVLLLCSCAKKQVVAEEKEITAPPKEVVKVEEEKPAAVEVAREVKKEEVKEPEKVEEAKVEKVKGLEKEAEEKVWEDRRGIRVEAEPIYFDFDKSFLRPEYRPVLTEKGEFLKDNPNIRIRIEGNCDERGPNEYNLALGERRAESAKQFLISLGISPDRIETISYGEERPLALGHNEDSWAQNRRDDFVITEK